MMCSLTKALTPAEKEAHVANGAVASLFAGAIITNNLFGLPMYLLSALSLYVAPWEDGLVLPHILSALCVVFSGIHIAKSFRMTERADLIFAYIDCVAYMSRAIGLLILTLAFAP